MNALPAPPPIPPAPSGQTQNQSIAGIFSSVLWQRWFSQLHGTVVEQVAGVAGVDSWMESSVAVDYNQQQADRSDRIASWMESPPAVDQNQQQSNQSAQAVSWMESSPATDYNQQQINQSNQVMLWLSNL